MQELAEQLKIERLKKGLTLKAVSEKAGISISVLQALENGRLDHVGTPFVVQSHLTAYAAALGIDIPSSFLLLHLE
jgi:cytoskeletal protein RodZ